MSLEAAVSSTLSNLQTFETKQKVAYELAAKSLDVARDQADAVLELIEGASPKGKSPGAGSRFDAQG